MNVLEEQNRSLQTQNRLDVKEQSLSLSLMHEPLAHNTCRSCEEKIALLEDEMEIAHQKQVSAAEELGVAVVQV